MQAEVSWRSPARIKNVRWLDGSSKDSREMAAIESISTSKSLWDIARGSEFEATIDKPTILGATDADGDACILKVVEVTVPQACNASTGPEIDVTSLRSALAYALSPSPLGPWGKH